MSSLASRARRAGPDLDGQRQVELPIVRLQEILHRPHDGQRQIRAIFHKSRLLEGLFTLAGDGEFNAFHPSRIAFRQADTGAEVISDQWAVISGEPAWLRNSDYCPLITDYFISPTRTARRPFRTAPATGS